MTAIQRAIEYLEASGRKEIQALAAELREIEAIDRANLYLEVKPDHWLVTGNDLLSGEQIGVAFCASEQDDCSLDPLRCVMANISRLGEAMGYWRQSDADGVAQLGREHRESIKLLAELLKTRRPEHNPGPRVYPNQPKCDSGMGGR